MCEDKSNDSVRREGPSEQGEDSERENPISGLMGMLMQAKWRKQFRTMRDHMVGAVPAFEAVDPYIAFAFYCAGRQEGMSDVAEQLGPHIEGAHTILARAIAKVSEDSGQTHEELHARLDIEGKKQEERLAREGHKTEVIHVD
jgi:hypothetical protein